MKGNSATPSTIGRKVKLAASLSSLCLLAACQGELSCTAKFPTNVNRVPGGAQTQTTTDSINVAGSLSTPGSSSALKILKLFESVFFNDAIAQTAPDAQNAILDTTGSNVTYPASGQITLTVTDTAYGTTLGTANFAWTRNGTQIKFSNPSSVNSWLATVGANAVSPSASWKFVNLVVTPTAGTTTETVAVAFKYDGQAASSTASRDRKDKPCPPSTPNCNVN